MTIANLCIKIANNYITLYFQKKKKKKQFSTHLFKINNNYQTSLASSQSGISLFSAVVTSEVLFPKSSKWDVSVG